MMRRVIAAYCLWASVTTAGAIAADVEFNRDIRPILSNKCYACHGPDEEAREAGLRLDQPELATEDRGGYRAIVPGDAENSELIQRVDSDDPFMVMPPSDHGEPLADSEVALLSQWIDQGAAYQKHWSLTPLEKPEVPAPSGDSGMTGNPIDAFVSARLAEENLTLSPPAAPRDLVRRLSFDVTGLPPEFEMVERFSADPTPEAYERLVDRLLQSPHYGERMAMYWLDLVRYADTLGYHGDQVRSVSPYRDYVIRAFNENKPFDQFTVEQLAGDLLPEATLWQKVASTYNRLNRASAEGGVQPKEYRAKYSADRVRTAGSVWLGSTLGCAECHDHKFDPFTAKDFYSFAAFFADIKEQGIVSGADHIEALPVPTPSQRARRQELAEQLARAEQAFQRDTAQLRHAFDRWVVRIREQAGLWQPLSIGEVRSSGGAKLAIQDDGSVLASGKNPDKDVYTVNIDTPPESLGALRLEELPHESLPSKGPGRAGNGNLVIQGVTAKLNDQEIEWESAVSTHAQANHSPAYVIGDNKNGWAILPETGTAHQLILTAAEPVSVSDRGDDTLVVQIEQNFGGGHNVGRFRISTAATDGEYLPAFASPELTELASIDPDRWTEAQRTDLWKAFREQTPLLAETRERLRRLRDERQQLKQSITTTLATTATEPRQIRVLPRGNWMDDSGEIVEPAAPHFLPPLGVNGRRATRLDLARWMTSEENPLVSRTFVNRLWMLFFGEGLCRSVDDLGSQGEWPTHPELLDWLAAEFVDSGWDVRHMVRLIVTSDTYRQSSAASPELRSRDPYNRLLARQSRRRLSAEMIRDNALTVSSLLVRRIGGESVKPYQPAGYWAQLNFPKRTYRHDDGARQYRRGLYTHWQRTFLHPSLLAFDAPAREECTAKRERSNTPLQALVLLNDPTFVEAARVLAERVLDQGGSQWKPRLRWLYRETLGREPREGEVALLRSLYEKNLAAYQQDPDAAEELLSTGLAPQPKGIDRAKLAAWTAVTRAILNLHETIVRY